MRFTHYINRITLLMDIIGIRRIRWAFSCYRFINLNLFRFILMQSHFCFGRLICIRVLIWHLVSRLSDFDFPEGRIQILSIFFKWKPYLMKWHPEFSSDIQISICVFKSGFHFKHLDRCFVFNFSIFQLWKVGFCYRKQRRWYREFQNKIWTHK